MAHAQTTATTHTNPVATIITMQQPAQPTTLRAQRVARVQVALHAHRIAAKQAKYASVTYATKLAAYNAAAAQLAASMGLPMPTPAKATSGPAKAPQQGVASPSGACATVRALAVANGFNRKATLAAAAAQGINPATAATQYAIAKTLHAQGKL